ncbi:hypothetical protein K7432_010772 [Basidiobolus ranarum]|uniref:Uncharacterized protein n=1 Tax=Basidiobolus ranarum TaxID=34480 RepID=A0ABR2VUX5_9FUNG
MRQLFLFSGKLFLEYFPFTMDVILSSVEVVVNSVSIFRYILPEINTLTEPIIENVKKEHYDVTEEYGVVINNILQYILKEKHVFNKLLANSNLENINQVDYDTPAELTRVCCSFLNRIKIHYQKSINELFAGFLKRGSLCIAYVFVLKYRERIFPSYSIFNPFLLSSAFLGTTVLGIGVLSKQWRMSIQLKDTIDTATVVRDKMYKITDNIHNLHSYKYAVTKDYDSMTDLAKGTIYSMLDLENKILAVI